MLSHTIWQSFPCVWYLVGKCTLKCRHTPGRSIPDVLPARDVCSGKSMLSRKHASAQYFDLIPWTLFWSLGKRIVHSKPTLYHEHQTFTVQDIWCISGEWPLSNCFDHSESVSFDRTFTTFALPRTPNIQNSRHLMYLRKTTAPLLSLRHLYSIIGYFNNGKQAREPEGQRSLLTGVREKHKRV